MAGWEGLFMMGCLLVGCVQIGVLALFVFLCLVLFYCISSWWLLHRRN